MTPTVRSFEVLRTIGKQIIADLQRMINGAHKAICALSASTGTSSVFLASVPPG